MRDFVFNYKKTVSIFFLFSFVIVSTTIYLSSQFFKKVSAEVVTNWYYAEIINLQQGNILSATAKLQRLVTKSGVINSVCVVNKDFKILMNFGEDKCLPYTDRGEQLFSTNEKLFSSWYVVTFSHLNIQIYTKSFEIELVSIITLFYIIIMISLLSYLIHKASVEYEKKQLAIQIQSIKNEYSWSTKLINLSKKMAHDIRSPISTLNLISNKIENPELKFLQQAVVVQINKISNDLLTEGKSSLVQNLISQGEVSLKDLYANIENEYALKKNSIKQSVIFYRYEKNKKNVIEFELSNIIYRCINNCIQNSIEATDENGVIEVSLAEVEGKPTITIKDNGKGIPQDVLVRIGSEPITYGKKHEVFNSGSGIAIYNAKQDLEKHGCKLEISSKLNHGTIITITLPPDLSST